jgi:hypothetical protein
MRFIEIVASTRVRLMQASRSRMAALPAALLVLAAASPALSGQDLPVPGQAATAGQGDSLVLASCDSGISQWSGDPPVIVTRHRCLVERTFLGATQTSITLQVLGGQIGEVSMGASAGAVLPPSADVVLRVRASEFGSYYVLVGGQFGALPVSGVGSQRKVGGVSLDEFERGVR